MLEPQMLAQPEHLYRFKPAPHQNELSTYDCERKENPPQPAEIVLFPKLVRIRLFQLPAGEAPPNLIGRGRAANTANTVAPVCISSGKQWQKTKIQMHSGRNCAGMRPLKRPGEDFEAQSRDREAESRKLSERSSATVRRETFWREPNTPNHVTT
jgi:hypothetical protein